MKGQNKYLKTLKRIKEEQIEQYGYPFCQNCMRSTNNLEGHHIIWRSEKPNHKNLHKKENIILCCRTCHDEFHAHKHKAREIIVKERKLDELFK